MLLTQNSSALRLLFECGLLQANSSGPSASNAPNAEVLIGSKFQRDNNELRIIEHINAIKRTMAKGGKAILVNHSSIYEALYDVLNQRYVTKVNSETGKTIRMLRLAIGNRSQLCEVAQGFKLIVIVEQHDAYEKLDLPLLNRFEKQVFGIHDVLTQQGLLLADKIEDWCKSIVEETGIVSPFVGFHSGTVPSLIFTLHRPGQGIPLATTTTTSFVNSSTNGILKDSDIENVAKKLLLQIATPLTLFSSKVAREILSDGQPSFEGVLKGITSGQPRNAVILTNSLCRDLSNTWLTEIKKGKISSNADIHMEMIILAELSSERDLVLATRAFLNNLKSQTSANSSKKHPGILVVQCDPLATDQQLIDHARWLCMREWPRQTSDSPQPTLESYTQIPSLIFVVHVPPSLSARTKRTFFVDFQKDWEFLFIDDLHSMSEETDKMLHHSAYELVENKFLSIEDILRSRFRSALALCRAPDISAESLPHNSSPKQQQQQISSILGSIELSKADQFHYDRLTTLWDVIIEQKVGSRFYQWVRGLIVSILRQHTHNLPPSEPQCHVRMVSSGECTSGSLRESLKMALEILVIRAFARIFLEIDCNFNVLLLKSFPELWQNLAESKNIFDSDAIIKKSRPLSGTDKETSIAASESEIISNSGSGITCVAQFPWSWKMIEILDNSQLLRDASTAPSQGKSETEIIRSLSSTIDGILGLSISETFPNGIKNEDFAFRYLYDILSMGKYVRHSGLSLHLQVRFCKDVICSLNEGKLESPSFVHACLIRITGLFLSSNSILSSLPKPVRMAVVEASSLSTDRVNSITSAEIADRVLIESCKFILEQKNKVNWVSRTVDSIRIETELLCTMSLDSKDKLKKESGLSLWSLVKVLHISLTEFYSSTNKADDNGKQLCLNIIADLDKVKFEKGKSLLDSVIECISICVKAKNEKRLKVSNITIDKFIIRLIEEFITFNADDLSVPKGILDIMEKGVIGSGNSWQITSAVRRTMLLSILKCSNIAWAHILEERIASWAARLKDSSLLWGKKDILEGTNALSTVNVLVDIIALCEDVHESFDKVMSKLKMKSKIYSHEPQTLYELYSFAKLRLDLREYCAKLLLVQSGKAKESQAMFTTMPFINELRDALKQSPQTRIFVLKEIASAGGSTLRKVLNNADFEIGIWLKYDKAKLEYIEQDAIDPFPWMFGSRAYSEASALIKEVSISEQAANKIDCKKVEERIFQAWKAESQSVIIGPFDLSREITEMTISLAGAGVASSKGSANENPLVDPNSPVLTRKPGIEILFAAAYSHFVSTILNKGKRTIVRNWLHKIVDTSSDEFNHSHSRADLNNCVDAITIGLVERELSRVSELASQYWRFPFISQLLCVSSIVALSLPPSSSWISDLLLDPKALASSFVPGMSLYVVDDIIAALGDYMGWWMCPNGHRYAVGECTRPMQEGKCPDCGAKVGGTNHNPVSGVKKIEGADRGKIAKTGYCRNEQGCPPNISGVSFNSIRVFSDILLYMSHFSFHGKHQALKAFGLPAAMDAALRDSLVQGLKDIEGVFSGESIENVLLLMNMFMILLRSLDFSTAPKLITTDPGRMKYLEHFSAMSKEFFKAPGLKYRILEAQTSLDEGNSLAYLHTCLGEDIWNCIFKYSNARVASTATFIPDEARLVPLLWIRRDVSSYPQLQALFASTGSQHQQVLRSFLKSEDRLHLIRYLIDIMNWQK